MAKSKKILKVSIWIEPATAFQMDVLSGAAKEFAQTFKSIGESMHKKNKVDITIEEDTRFS